MSATWIEQAAQKGLQLLDAETAHRVTVLGLKSGLVPARNLPADPRLSVKLWDLTFPNPL